MFYFWLKNFLTEAVLNLSIILFSGNTLFIVTFKIMSTSSHDDEFSAVGMNALGEEIAFLPEENDLT